MSICNILKRRDAQCVLKKEVFLRDRNRATGLCIG